MLVGRRMTEAVLSVSPKDTLLHASDLMSWNNIRHLPVLDANRLVGVITDRDIRLCARPQAGTDEEEARDALATATIDKLMSTDLITADPLMPIEEAAKLLRDHRIGCLPVISDGALVGIITQTDVLAAFIEIMGVHEPSSRLEVEIEPAPGQLAAILCIIKEHKTMVSSVVTTPSDDGKKRIAVIRLKTINPQAVVRSLLAAEHNVLWPPQR